MGGFLQKVLDVKRQEIVRDKEYIKSLEKKIEARQRSFNFTEALKSCGTKIIAEVKKASPSMGHIRNVEPHIQAQAYQEAGAVAISVLTDKSFFNGSLEDLAKVSESVELPVLRKDFVIDKIQILEAKAFGADAVLLIVKMLEEKELKELLRFSLELGLTPLVEVFSLDEVKLALDVGAEVIGVNNRDLDTLKIDINLSKRLIPEMKSLGVKFAVAESGIDNREQILELINLGADAFLIGTSLMKSEDPKKKLKELLGFP